MFPLRTRAAVAVTLALLAFCGSCSEAEPPSDRTPPPAAVSLPPAKAGFDYQQGGAYPPPAGVGRAL